MTKKVYIGSDNPTRVAFFRDGAPFSFSGITRVLVQFRESEVEIDTATQPTLVDYSVGSGNIDFYFGNIGLPEGTYSLFITLYTDEEEQVLVDYDHNLQFNFVEFFDFDLVVQDDSGTEADSNSYIDVAYFKQYHKIRGNSFSDFDDFEIKQAIVRAFDFIEVRFEYISERLTDGQNSEWPRYGITTIPRAIKEAQCEYALRALFADINPDPDNISNGRLIASKSEGVGPLSESYTYDTNAGDYVMPNYPVADKKIQSAGLVRSQNASFLMRG